MRKWFFGASARGFMIDYDRKEITCINFDDRTKDFKLKA
jgi:hypothetical protein